MARRDGAHPMYPRGSNGSAQSLIDARTLADLLSQGQPFGHIDDLISQAELRKISDNYKQVAGFAAKS